ncbi:MAG: LruC domain-containing protein [Paludibacter sp.]
MKTLQLSIALTLLLSLTLSSCLKDNNSDIITDPSASVFDFKTTKEYKVSIVTLTNENLPFSGVQVKLFSENPMNSDGTLKADSIIQKILIYTGNTNEGGILTCQIAPATTVDSLSILVNQIGLPSLLTVKLSSTDINVQIGGTTKSGIKGSKVGPSKVLGLPLATVINGFYTLGTWDNQGVPNYLSTPNDVITASLLADINSSLPEYKHLTDSHPQYLDDANDGSVKLYKDAEVWVTFVHEGAGYMNTLAYYTYTNGNSPTSINDIKDKTIIYPNVSYSGSGGGLTSGNKVQLLYLDPKTNTYSKIFPAGKTVAWVLHAMGWSGSNIKTINNTYTYYSDSKLNPELDLKLKKHNVILNDAGKLIVSFEDMRRDQGSDNDFNDAVFYATINPIEAIDQTQYKVVDKPIDTDNDGVTDVNDEYPKDATKAHNNYYPAKGQTGTLAFEDLWPSKGDYDFNDVVVDYNYNQITNAQNKVVAVNATYTLRASGANNHDGFGIQFNTDPGNVISVTGQHISNGFINNAVNGTENGQNKAVIIAFDDAKNLLKTYNTMSGSSYTTPITDSLKITFATPIDAVAFGAAPYNPFIIINKVVDNVVGKERGKEVHLSGSVPTTLADLSLLGTGDDNSNAATGKYYTSDKYLPWAINIPVKFDYPVEKEDITKAYLKFNSWATSKGANYTDWYTSKAGYRDTNLIFKK